MDRGKPRLKFGKTYFYLGNFIVSVTLPARHPSILQIALNINECSPQGRLCRRKEMKQCSGVCKCHSWQYPPRPHYSGINLNRCCKSNRIFGESRPVWDTLIAALDPRPTFFLLPLSLSSFRLLTPFGIFSPDETKIL
jgi:hypothetical protein